MYLAEIFTDHMVLQRDKDICVFGYGKGSGEIEFCGKTYTFTSTTEKFYVYLAPQSVGGPYEMMVTLNGSTRVIKDILIGDVYIAAGQSNMELPLCATHNIEYFENENIRFLPSLILLMKTVTYYINQPNGFCVINLLEIFRQLVIILQWGYKKAQTYQ